VISLPFASAISPELDGFFRRKIANNKPIHPRFFAVADEFLLAVSHHGIIISHEQHRDLEPTSPDILDDLKRRCDCDAVAEGNLSRFSSAFKEQQHWWKGRRTVFDF
jgi:hypothetical protein